MIEDRTFNRKIVGSQRRDVPEQATQEWPHQIIGVSFEIVFSIGEKPPNLYRWSLHGRHSIQHFPLQSVIIRAAPVDMDRTAMGRNLAGDVR